MFFLLSPHPTKTKVIAEMMRIKADRIDSHALAEPIKGWMHYPQSYMPDEEISDFKEKVRGRAIPCKRNVQNSRQR
jgi:hypothetical protein